MAFRKTGDAMPIEGYYGDDGKEVCSKCGEPLVVVAVGEDSNKLVCESCEIQDEDLTHDCCAD